MSYNHDNGLITIIGKIENTVSGVNSMRKKNQDDVHEEFRSSGVIRKIIRFSVQSLLPFGSFSEVGHRIVKLPFSQLQTIVQQLATKKSLTLHFMLAS